MNKSIRVLLSGASRAESDQVLETLRLGGFSVLSRSVARYDEFTHALEDFAPDVVVSNPQQSGLELSGTLVAVHAVRPLAAVILLQREFDAEAAVASLRAGAEAVVVKSHLRQLVGLIKSALEVRRPLTNLTSRQMQVFRLVTAGRTTREIAYLLGISPKTAEAHRGEVMKRLRIDTLAGLVRYAVRVGLVPSEHAAPLAGPTLSQGVPVLP